jgi:beta-N-acetylhexosaminidase
MPKSAIFGCQDLTLSLEEKDFFKKNQPLGFILFKRNCESKQQVIDLVTSLKNCLDHKDVPILIDQEGGRVVRLTPPVWDNVPPASFFYKNYPLEEASRKVYDNARKIAGSLTELGINFNCAPCADLLFDDADPIISDRAFAKDPNVVYELSKQMLQGLYDGGVIPIIKHALGHGRAKVDSHLELPILDNTFEEIKSTDFLPFKKLFEYSNKNNIPAWVMTAHIIFKCIDKNNTITQSSLAIKNIIRKQMGFQGLIISDCLSMKALEGNYFTKAKKALDAGCDIALLCQGSLDDYEEVLKACSEIASK